MNFGGEDPNFIAYVGVGGDTNTVAYMGNIHFIGL